MTGLHSDFRMSQPNADVPLYEGPLTLTLKGRSSEFQGHVALAWWPTPRIRFVAERPSVPDDLRLWIDSGPRSSDRLHIPGTAESVAVLPSTRELSDHGPLRFEGHLNAELTLICAGPMVRVEGLVVNLSDYWSPGQRGAWCWEADDWKVTVSPVPGLTELIKAVRRAGGYVITHRLAFERADGASFSATDADIVLHGLFRFLSFLQGRRVNVVLPVGYDSSGAPVWRKWLPWNVGAWQGVHSWADPLETDHLGEAFRGFMRLWAEPGWRDALDAAIPGTQTPIATPRFWRPARYSIRWRWSGLPGSIS